MELGRKELDKDQDVKVLSLFEHINQDLILEQDPLTKLLEDAQAPEEKMTSREVHARRIVAENLFPDQSLFILEEQLGELRSRLRRLKFYLDEVNDLIPSKNL